MNIYSRQNVDAILQALLSKRIEDSDSFVSSLRRVATWDAPGVDYAFQDNESGKTVALLFFNDEYIDNLESLKSCVVQAINSFDAVVTAFDVRYLEYSQVFYEILESNRLLSLPIGIVAYDGKGSVVAIQKFTVPRNVALNRTIKEQKSYWCWWRDSSHYEVALLLELSSKYTGVDGDIYSSKVYPEFFSLMIEGKTKKWDGKPRIKKYSSASYKSEKQNYKIPMCQLGLWDAETGHLTPKGIALLEVIRKYGESSKEYFDCLAKLVLVDGKHLDLVKDLEDFQKRNPQLIPETSSEFFILFDEYMMEKNSIGTRKPSAITTGAKRAYVRDEPKLWNKLGILKMLGASRYYRAFSGIEFDWTRINEILLSNVLGGISGKL